MKQVYFIPNIVTAFGLACGLFVIFKTNMIEPGSGTFQLVQTSAILLLVAALADVLDGAIARAIKAESEFGEVFDSLADAVSFGVAPSVVLLKTLSLEQGTGWSFYAVVGAMLFSIGGVLRLARYNVLKQGAKGNAEALAAHNKSFTGLPIPWGALAAIGANLFFFSPIGEKLAPMSDEMRAITLSSIFIVLGYFMVSKWKFPSVKMLHFRVPSFQLVFVAVIFAMFMLYGILYYFPLVLAALTWGYVIISWILSIIRLIAGKKSKTLEEFEPENDD
jgi:CDP-diacylglycerol--serine O-phosphatidyltransferase